MKIICLLLLISVVPAVESWNKEQLEKFVSENVMSEYHHTQVTAWGTWNFLDLDMEIMAIDGPNGMVNYTIRLPENLVDSYIFVGACNYWSSSVDEKRTRELVQFQSDLNANKTIPITFMFKKDDQNTSFVTIEGWKNSKQYHCRIWLCGFQGSTAVGKLDKFIEPWPRLTRR